MTAPAPREQTGAGERASRLALAGLATWRLTHLLALEDGPADAVVRLRELAGAGPLGELMDCFDCLSIWVAAGFAPFLARRPRERLVGWLALSGFACALQRIAAPGEASTAAPGLVIEEEDAAAAKEQAAEEVGRSELLRS